MMTSGIGLCCRWVPRQLSNDYNRARQMICQGHLDRHARKGVAFLHQIVTGDESWVYHYEPEGKRQSMQWKHPSSPATQKFKTQAFAGKVMLTIFWDIIFFFAIFTICFDEAMCKWVGCLHFEWRCCPATVLRREVTLLFW
jgi:hypothetical protein